MNSAVLGHYMQGLTLKNISAAKKHTVLRRIMAKSLDFEMYVVTRSQSVLEESTQEIYCVRFDTHRYHCSRDTHFTE